MRPPSTANPTGRAVRSADRRPSSNRLWAVLCAKPELTVSLVAALTGGLWAATSLRQVPDPTLFAEAGRALFSKQWSDVFSDPQLQVGPLYLAFVGIVAVLAEVLGVPTELAVAIVASALIGLGTVLVTRQALALQNRQSAVVELGAGLTVTLAAPLCATAWGGHFEELITALLLLIAAHFAARSRYALAGVLIGLAACTKMWGLLGIGILLIDVTPTPLVSWVRLRKVLVGLVTAVGVVALGYVPFVAFGDVATLAKTWSTAFPAPLALMANGEPFTFTMRAGQAVCAVAAGGVLAVVGRRDVRTLWTVPAVTITARLLLDPFVQSYYLAPLLLITAIGVWAMDSSSHHTRALAVAAAMPVTWLVLTVAGGQLGAVLATVLLTAAVGGLALVRAAGPLRHAQPTEG